MKLALVLLFAWGRVVLAAPVPVSVVDDLGNTILIESAPTRVVSLSPGATEILYALGVGETLGATCKYCNYPVAAQKLPRVGDFMNPNLEAIIAQQPDLIITTGGVQRELVLKLQRIDIPNLMLYPHSVEEVLRNIDILGQVFRVTEAAKALIDRIRSRVEELTRDVSALPEAQRPKVYVEMWGDPLMAVGDRGYFGELIRLAGAVNILRGLSEAEYPKISAEHVIKANPDVMLLAHGDDPEHAAEYVGKRPGWSDLSAVRSGRVYADLDMDLLYRPGPRLVDGLEQLIKRFHQVK